MRFRRNRRRSRVTWSHADEAIADILDDGNNIYVPLLWLLPPGRAQYLMDTDRVSSLTYAGSHIWMDYYWYNTSSDRSIPDFNLFVMKTTEDTANAPSMQWYPFRLPKLPSTLSSWDNADDDGTSSFLWVHHIKGSSPPNAVINNNGVVGTTHNDRGANQYRIISTGTSDNYASVCRIFDVRAAWQPDVIIKTKRRLMKTEGILLVMNVPTQGTNTYVHMEARARTLVKRGR